MQPLSTRITRARSALERAHQALRQAHERIQQARERDPGLCHGFPRYGGVKNELDQARALLDRSTYRVALAGMMSAGKSTLTNALLRRPGLLPTGIEETTLTITVVRRPDDGLEGMTVEYLTYEEAIRGLFERGSYRQCFSDEVLAKVQVGAPPDVLRAEISVLASTGEMPDDVREQLIGFLEALDDYRHLLGTTIHPPLEERRRYLAPRHHRDVGHLLLIARAVLRVEAELLERDGLEFVDLPGADSTNERQRRIAYDYLKDTDLLIAVPNAAGFRFVDIDMLSRFRQARGEIRDRVFFALNRFDEAKVADLAGAEASLAYFQKLVDMLSRDYEPRNLFFTVGLWATLEQCQEESTAGFGEDDDHELQRVRESARSLIDHFERQGVLDTMDREWNERYGPALAGSLRAVRQGGGVEHLRRELVRYLRQELELARLSEVRDHLEGAARHIEDLVASERSRVAGFLDSAREQLKATGSFLNQVAYLTRAALEGAHHEQARREGETDEFQFRLTLRRLSQSFALAIEGILSQDNDLIDFRKLAHDSRVDSAEVIMRRVIDQARAVLSDKFVDLLTGKLAPEFVKRYRDALTPLENDVALSEFGRVIERPDLGQRFLERLDELERTLILVTRSRAREETWTVSRVEFNPTPGPRPFGEVEAEFRQALILEMQVVYADRFKALGDVLLKYYRLVLDDFLTGFEEITAEALREARLMGAQVPVELLVARASEDDRRRYGLAELVGVADEAGRAMDEVRQTLNGGGSAPTTLPRPPRVERPPAPSLRERHRPESARLDRASSPEDRS
jgi:Dynamin family